MCLIILHFWQGFEYASDTKYVSVLDMLEYSYNNIIIIIIIIITNFIILEFLFGWFVYPGALQLTNLSFFKHKLEHKNNES